MFKYIDISSVDKGLIHWGQVNRYRFTEAPSRARRIIREGDVLLCTVRPGLQAHTRISRGEEIPFVASTGFAVLRPNTNEDSSFIFHQIFSNDVVAQLRAKEVGSNYPAVNEADVKRLSIFMPEPSQRQAVGKVLDTIDEAITATEVVIAKLKQARAGMLHDLLSYGLDENGQIRDPIAHPEQFKDTPLGCVPKNWDAVRLVDRADVFGGKRLPGGHTYSDLPTGFRYLRVLDFFEKPISYAELASLEKDTFAALTRYEIHDGELFISIAGSIGYIGVLRPKKPERIILTENAARISIRNGFLPDFLCLFMNGESVQRQINAEKGIGGGVPKLALHRIERLWIAVPKPEEQERIICKAVQLDQQMKAEQTELNKLQKIKSGLQDDLLTGRVPVPETIMEGATMA